MMSCEHHVYSYVMLHIYVLDASCDSHVSIMCYSCDMYFYFTIRTCKHLVLVMWQSPSTFQVLAKQILSIQRVVITHLSVPLCSKGPLSPSNNPAVCITMNPGYAGHSKLPDNLKETLACISLPPSPPPHTPSLSLSLSAR